MPEAQSSPDVATLAVQLLSAYLANNTVPAQNLPDLIRSTRAALVADAVVAAEEPQAPTYTPAVSVRKSLASSEHIVSLIDGKPYKTLKRHLRGHGLTPETYRERYGLPASYPMVAPAFGELRRAIAAKIGLGGRAKASAEEAVEDAAPSGDSAAPEAASQGAKASPARTAKPTPGKAKRPAKTTKASSRDTAVPAATAPVSDDENSTQLAVSSAAPATGPEQGDTAKAGLPTKTRKQSAKRMARRPKAATRRIAP